MYVIKGFQYQNRKTYQEGRNGDIWREVYDQFAKLEVKPTVHKVKSHMTVPELMSLMLVNPEATKWMICNEAADAAAGTYADHLGSFDKEHIVEVRDNFAFQTKRTTLHVLYVTFYVTSQQIYVVFLLF